MAQRFNPSALGWTDGNATPFVQNFTDIASDIASPLVAINGNGYGRANTAWLVLVPGALPGTLYTVMGASWASGVATLTIGTHVLQVGQRATIASITPSGYNMPDTVVTAVTSTTISYAVTVNPGAWSGGGTVLVDETAAAKGMVKVDSNGNFRLYDGSNWRPTWANGALQNGWGVYGGGYLAPGYALDVNGKLMLRGGSNGGTITDGTLLFTLPAGSRPPGNIWLDASGYTGSAAFSYALNITTGGAVNIYGVPSNHFIGLDGVTFSTI